MRKATKIALSGALLGVAATSAIPMDAFAMTATPPSAVLLPSRIDAVEYRRRGEGYRPHQGYRRAGYRGYRPLYGGYYRGGASPGAAALAAGLLGAGLAASSDAYYGGYYPYYSYGYSYPGYGYGYYNYPAYDYWGW
jgi:hypothetical protein